MPEWLVALFVVLFILGITLTIGVVLFLLFAIDKETVSGVTTKIQKVFHRQNGAHKRRRTRGSR